MGTNKSGTAAALAGANVLLNLSASNELISKADYRRDLVCMKVLKIWRLRLRWRWHQ